MDRLASLIANQYLEHNTPAGIKLCFHLLLPSVSYSLPCMIEYVTKDEHTKDEPITLDQLQVQYTCIFMLEGH